MKNLDVKLFIIGEKTEIFEKLSKNYGIEHEISETLSNAISSIDKIHTKSSIALLSPACASFDQFKSYKHRGEEFKNFVSKI
jgi:UDP-N-acetylmuramoylalanine--D-glutamate ligase